MLALIGLALGLALGSQPAQAQTILTSGNNPQTDENILLNEGGPASLLVTGTGNNTGFQVNFTSTQQIVAPSGGQAKIEAATAALNQISIALLPGFSFTSLIANVRDGTGTATINATDTNDVVTSFPGFGLSNGENFFTLTTSGNTRIAKVEITAASGFSDLRQVRLGGAGPTPTPFNVQSAPEPMSMMLLGAGALPFIGCLRRRRRQKDQAEGPAAV